MHIALFTDIHGNREALAACLDHAERAGVGRMVFLGDYIGYGADPAWVVDTVMARVERGAVAIAGNHDAALTEGTARMNENAATSIAWTRTQLAARHEEFLRALPLTITEDDRLYVHASADAPEKWHYIIDLFTASRSLIATRAQTTFCGHVHVPALYHLSPSGKVAGFQPVERIEIPLSRHRRWLAVIGSVGQPRDGNPAACFAVFDDERDILTYIRVPYDVDSAARKIREAGLPIALSYRLLQGF